MKGLLIEVWTKLRETKRPMARSLYAPARKQQGLELQWEPSEGRRRVLGEFDRGAAGEKAQGKPPRPPFLPSPCPSPGLADWIQDVGTLGGCCASGGQTRGDRAEWGREESGSEGAIREYPGQASSINMFKVIVNFTWEDQRVKNSKEQFWRPTGLL